MGRTSLELVSLNLFTSNQATVRARLQVVLVLRLSTEIRGHSVFVAASFGQFDKSFGSARVIKTHIVSFIGALTLFLKQDSFCRS